MPHEMINEIVVQKGQKVAIFLTVENTTGLIIGGVIPFLITFLTTPWYLCLIITITGLILGFLATVDIGGMAMYERCAWWMRGAITQRQAQRVLPEDLVGGRAVGQRDAAIPLDGPVRRIQPKRSIQRPTTTPFRKRSIAVELTKRNGQAHESTHAEEEDADIPLE